MKIRPLFLGLFALSASLLVAAEDSHKLTATKALPDGLSKGVAAQLDPAGWQLSGPDGKLLSVWVAKSVDIKPDFSATLEVKYPFKPGQLVGALHVDEGVEATDFRGQELEPGTYTLRYGQQPQDGNHIGTSLTRDFLLALPAKIDQDPAIIEGFDSLSEKSARAVGTTHPAIFSLAGAQKDDKSGTLRHDEDQEFWLLQATIEGKAKDKAVKVPVRMVVVGRGLE